MKKRLLHVYAICFMFCALFICLTSVTVHASRREVIISVDYSDNMTIMADPGYGFLYELYPHVKQYPLIKGAVSSNPSVVEFDSVGGVEDCLLYIRAKKPGCATLTITLYSWPDKCTTRKVRIKVVKYQSPFKTFKIGKTNIRPALESKSRYSKIKLPIGKAFVNIKLNKGWKILKDGLHICGKHRYKKDEHGYPIEYDQYLTNQKIFNFNGKNIKWNCIYADIYNPKYKLPMYYTLYF